MNRPGWIINRLKAMGVAEIARRTARRLGEIVEQRRVESGWAPRPAAQPRRRKPLFDPPDSAGPEPDRDALARLAAGQVDFFGGDFRDIGMPPRWHRDPETGTECPRGFGKRIDYRDATVVGNIKLVWEMGRHQHLVPLAAAYALTGRHEYRDAVYAQLDSFVTDNPYGKGIHWCSALEAALRLISWAAIDSLIALRDGEGPVFAGSQAPQKLREAIYEHAWFVRHFTSRDSSANNHLIGELTGLYVACSVFDLGAQGAHWAGYAQRELEREALKQVHGDGVNREQAVYYHLWVLDYFLLAELVGRRYGTPFSSDFAGTVASMHEFLVALAPDGRPPQIGDADDGFVLRFDAAWPRHPYRDMLETADAVMFEAPAENPKPFWYARIATAPRARPVEHKRFFADGGYAILGNDRVRLVFDAGPLGYLSIAAHGHADALNLCLSVDGRWWLVDPGTYAYHAEPRWRSYFRGTAAHNTVTIDGQDQSLQGGPFLWLRHGNGRFVEPPTLEEDRQHCAGTHDGYRHLGVGHRRDVCWDERAGAATIEDSLSGRRRHEIAMAWHFAPGLEIERSGTAPDYIVGRSGHPASLRLALPPELDWDVYHGSEQPVMGWYSRALGHKQPSPTLRGTGPADLPQKLVTRLVVELQDS